MKDTRNNSYESSGDQTSRGIVHLLCEQVGNDRSVGGEPRSQQYANVTDLQGNVEEMRNPINYSSSHHQT